MTATASHHTTSAKPAATKPFTLSLDDLLELAPDDLRVLYESASVPKLTDVHGDLEGRMLASPFLGRRVADGVRALARSKHFPWRGKSFTPQGEKRGDGINRVFTDKNKWFRFETFIGKSLAGDFDALQLDYENRDNPAFIRIIKDEIRTLRPGLFLGQAYVVTRGKATLALYFALADKADGARTRG